MTGGEAARAAAWRRLAPALLALVTVVAFVDAAPSVVIHDDAHFAPLAGQGSWSRIVDVFHHDTWENVGHPAAGTYRPLFLTLIQVMGLVFGAGPRGLHVMAIVIHLAATLVLFGFLHAVLRDAWPGARTASPNVPVLAAWVAALIFGIHPVHTEAIDSFFNSSDAIATLGSYGALWIVWSQGDRRSLLAWGCASVIYFVTLLFRESAIVMPALMVIVLWFLRVQGTPGERLRRVAPVAVLAIPLAVYTLMRTELVSWPVWAGGRLTAYLSWRSWSDRLATTVSTLADSVEILVWPHPLRYSYDEYVAHAVPLAIVLNAALLALAAASWRRRPSITVGLSAFYLGLLPSTVLVQDFMLYPGIFAERYLYFPSAALTIPLAFGLAALAAQRGGHAVAALATVVYLVFAPLTLLRNEDWHGALQLYEADYRADPSNGQNASYICEMYAQQHRVSEAVALCDRFFREHPENDPMAEACTAAYRQVGRPDDGRAALRRAAMASKSPHTLTLLARMDLERGDRASAEAEYQLAVEHSGTPVAKHIRRGEALVVLHPERLEEARAEFNAALELDPGSASARNWLHQADVVARRNAESQASPPP